MQKKEDEIFQRMERVVASKRLYAQRNLSLDMLAREVGYNRSYISSTLRHRGFTFSTYIDTFRVQRLIQLLSDPGCSALEALELAERCGFLNDRAMNYHLNSIMGISFSFLRRRSLLMNEDSWQKAP